MVNLVKSFQFDDANCWRPKFLIDILKRIEIGLTCKNVPQTSFNTRATHGEEIAYKTSVNL